jgi:hypothetical protein
LQAADITGLTTTPTNVDLVNIVKKYDYIYYNVDPADLANTIRIPGFKTGSVSDATSNIGNIASQNTTTLKLAVAKGTYANLAAAQAAFTGTSINYQLANPIVTKLSPYGGLIATPNGSLIWEPIIKDESVYSTNIANASGYAIKTLRKVQKVTINADNSRTYTDIDIATCTVAGDGLTFTSTALANGNMVYWEADYDSALTTLPSLYISYPTNLKDECDRNSEAVGKLSAQIKDLNDFTVAMLLNHEARLTAHTI